ncbi:MAG: hypothetical protein V4610_14070 [Pseudomonadota bacterium]
MPDQPGRVAAELALCLNCRQFVRDEEVSCPHCGWQLSAASERHAAAMAEAHAAFRDLAKRLGLADVDPER